MAKYVPAKNGKPAKIRATKKELIDAAIGEAVPVSTPGGQATILERSDMPTDGGEAEA